MKQLKNYLSILSMLIALSLLTFISCTPDTEKEDLICKVSVEISEGGIGVVSKTEVISGEEVTLKAVPEATYRFVNWTVGGKEVSKENPYTTTITATTQFKPNFEKDNYAIKVTAGEGGEVTPTEETVLNGTKVTLTATPNVYYKFVSWTVNGEEVSTNATYTAIVIANTEFKANFVKNSYYPTGAENGKDLVDLGLPSGLKWATCNVGATKPEEYGDYFAWGETSTKSSYSSSNYTYTSNLSTLPLTADAARVNWGGNWRMPTRAEQDELRDTNNCTWTWTTQNGVNGYKVTSVVNGNSIFLPAAGYRYDDYLYYAGDCGLYWSSSLCTINSSRADYLNFSSFRVTWDYFPRSYGFSVRAVCE